MNENITKKEYKALVIGCRYYGENPKDLEKLLNDGFKIQSLTPIHDSANVLVILEK